MTKMMKKTQAQAAPVALDPQDLVKQPQRGGVFVELIPDSSPRERLALTAHVLEDLHEQAALSVHPQTGALLVPNVQHMLTRIGDLPCGAADAENVKAVLSRGVRSAGAVVILTGVVETLLAARAEVAMADAVRHAFSATLLERGLGRAEAELKRDEERARANAAYLEKIQADKKKAFAAAMGGAA